MRIVLLIVAIGTLLACGTSTGTDAQPGTLVPPVSLPVLFHGNTLVEEKILDSTIAVRATMTSLSSEVVVDDADNVHRAVLKFNLSVSEYLKGTGPSNIVAVWVDGRSYDTSSAANGRKAVILARRDDQWDDREAIIFLFGATSGFGTLLDGQLQRADYFLLAFGDPYSSDDRYSLHSRTHKDWLPAASSASSTGDGQEFLLDAPASGSTTPTITLGELKTRIIEIIAEFDGGDGSEAYKECVRDKYEFERRNRYTQEVQGEAHYDQSPSDSELVSGQPASTQIHQRQNGGIYPSQKARTWLEGRDASLFSVVQGEPTPIDVDEDGALTAGMDAIEFTETFTIVRPLPAGEYEIDRKEVWTRFLPCNYALSNDWTVTVTAPEGVLHELFFDPVTVGTTVSADDANGQLKPTSFTGANGSSATIDAISWDTGASDSGTVKIEVDPDYALAGHILDFIELDGSVSLSLDAFDASVDTVTNTLTWSVSSQPWHDGDLLMVRIREAE